MQISKKIQEDRARKYKVKIQEDRARKYKVEQKLATMKDL